MYTYLKILISFSLVVVFFVFSAFRWKYSYWRRKGVFYVVPEVVYGNVKVVLKHEMASGVHTKLIYTKIKEAKESFGGFYALTDPVLLITDPKVIKNVLVKDSKHFYNRHFHFTKYLPPIFDNLVTYRGEKWKRVRTKISPTFTPSKMTKMFQNVLECCVDMNEFLERKVETKQSVNIRDLMSRLVLDNIATSAFGYESNCVKDPRSDFFKYALLSEEHIFKSLLSKLAQFFPKILMGFRLYTFFSIPNDIFEIKDYFTNILIETIDHRLRNNVQKNDFLDMFLKIMKNSEGFRSKEVGLSFDELSATAFSFYVGGYHTTESSLTFAFLELAQNQDIQNTLREEIRQTLRKYDGKTTYECIMGMKYLDQVISETLRKYPIIPILLRECNEDYKLDGTNVVIDKGTKVWVCAYGLHMDPEYYPEPEKFDPDRFSDEENEKRLPFTYLPFGEGHRICIGKRLGLLQMKVTMVEVLKLYRLTVDPRTVLPVDFEPENVFLGPKNTIWLNVYKIKDKTN